ncbi:hypothetical protein AMAG_11105 [Allomyces macrogynus ATCC 38327]|uniref:Uncharacterized protein n=1 Tax=Allomyces macrogynus (strain ATCC 38327) TaxID=578462 RepID=A0A0L0SSM1_ALLM3|nr:hypothetical protein AMAG_11105 [Allomyces macrogynus ATCC 38327]|eukprot:KNE65486.1 hypothetical protein AMAG_11105 [Allomyces macrogynus ATCC 38327]
MQIKLSAFRRNHGGNSGATPVPTADAAAPATLEAPVDPAPAPTPAPRGLAAAAEAAARGEAPPAYSSPSTGAGSDPLLYPQPPMPATPASPAVPEPAEPTTIERKKMRVRRKVIWTSPFLLKALLALASITAVALAAIAMPDVNLAVQAYQRTRPVPTTASKQEAADAVTPPSFFATPFMAAYLWLMVGQAGYALAYLLFYGGCLYNPYATKRHVSRRRQRAKLELRRFVLFPLECGLTITWTVMGALMGLWTDPAGVYQASCHPVADNAVKPVSCDLAKALVGLVGIVAALMLVSAMQLRHTIMKNRAKVRKLADEERANAEALAAAPTAAAPVEEAAAAEKAGDAAPASGATPPNRADIAAAP